MSSTSPPTLPKWAFLKNPGSVARFQQRTAEGLFKLSPGETWWRDHYNLLNVHGYSLRPRYQPDWSPSWLGTNISPIACEDHLGYSVNESLCLIIAHHIYNPFHQRTEVMDATRKSDGRKVMIKRLWDGEEETAILKSMSTPERQNDPANHCVLLLDDIPDDVDPDLRFLVMPLLRRFNSPTFSFVNEAMDFMRQTLEGLEYIHRHDVAHRDLARGNIMMDATALYPEGFHPYLMNLAPTAIAYARHFRRADVGGVRYLFIDFGCSTAFEDPAAPRLVTGSLAQDPDVPELSEDTLYDPFAVDVFTLGNVFKKEFLQNYSNIEFARPLVDLMTSLNPKSRPSASVARSQFEEIILGVKPHRLRWALKPRDEPIQSTLSRNFTSAAREVLYLSKSIAKFPPSR